MEKVFITPQEVATRLLKLNYPGNRQGNVRRVRMALIGALRSGEIEWRCERWCETFTAESGAVYDENGGETCEGPKYGWPPDFWQPSLAVDDVLWRNNAFISHGLANQGNVKNKIRLWLSHNGESWAEWTRFADDVMLNWTDAEKLLVGPGWQSWVVEAHEPRRPPSRSRHYETALVNLIAIAVSNPAAIRDRTQLFDELIDAFDGHIPDDAELRRLARRISQAVQPEDDPPV